MSFFPLSLCAEELVKNHHLDDANRVFLKGAEGGLRATDELYDILIEEDCKAGDHSNALTIAYEMEAAGRMATTFHFNCLLSVQVILGGSCFWLSCFITWKLILLNVVLWFIRTKCDRQCALTGSNTCRCLTLTFLNC